MKKSFFKNIILLIGLIILSNNLFAENNFDEENITIHLDKSFYVTGEVVWYKVYLPKDFEGQAVTLKSTVMNEMSTIKHYAHHATDGKAYFSSYYKIPFDTRSGVYSLIISGIKTSTGKTIKLAEVGIPIYNDLEKVRVAKEDLLSPNNIPNNTPPLSTNPLKVSVELDKSSYANRGKVNVVVKVTDAAGQPIEGNCSIAVTDHSIAGDMALPIENIISNPLPPNIIAKNINNSINVRGLFLDKDKAPKKVEIMGVFSPKENQFIFTSSNDKGEFSIEVPNYSGDKPVQFVNHYEIDNDVEVKFSNDLKREIKQDLIYTEGIISYLKLSRERKKIFQMFKGFESDVKPVSSKFEKKTLNADKKYNLRNYSTFEDLPMFFTEVLTYLKFSKKGKKYVAKMTNPTPTWEGTYPGAPMFMVDGKITRDADFVSKIEYSHIDQVNLFFDLKNLKKQFNIIGKSGVVEIMTDLPKILLPEDDEKNIFNLTGLQPEADFPVFETSQVSDNKRLPFFRPQLYWNDNVVINPNGEGRFSFTQNDDESTFKVKVLVQGKNGEMGIGEVVYEVEIR